MNLSRTFGYTNNQLRTNSPLSNEQIARVAPSVFADAPHASRSARYTYIPTSQVLDGLRKEGFQPFFVAQGRTRVEGKAEYTKHLLRLRHESQIAQKEAHEIILLNSHDGTSSYQMLSGMIRFVCTNGMVCGEQYDDVRIPHKGDVVGRVIEGAYEVLRNAERIDGSVDVMKSLTLSRDEQSIFADAALQLRYDDESAAPIAADRLLTVRRMDDRQNDLWSTFNVVQENSIRGGLNGRARNGRRTSTRAVTGIDQDTKLNRALWTLAEKMAELKGIKLAA